MFRKLLLTAMACGFLAAGLVGCEEKTTPPKDTKKGTAVTPGTPKAPGTAKAPGTPKEGEKK